ncbi:hypothetical protein SynBIOSE41_00824 [Synechococcus sp. BIOS-E4-1]|uniref:hypothetical protein n=1 Tax=Synechococcus sp. BIOS-E4-1 TaxID=1400864 RepID=UPI00164551C3|nr:hypothetical protein [Synechococcus sp. BIOS-E4-1]QNI53356.1 hypothetical protein SynBIOSE41_00824 [Synechococcus sp. BIOS-E4-1]
METALKQVAAYIKGEVNELGQLNPKPFPMDDKTYEQLKASVDTIDGMSAENVLKELPETIAVADLSDDSKDILLRFGLEAPAKLNAYSIAVEDNVIELCEKNHQLKMELEELRLRHKALQAALAGTIKGRED